MTRVLIVEASTGGVVGGSLSGLYHLIRGMDREHFHVAMALYERKAIESELACLDVSVHHVRRARLPKQHALLPLRNYQRAKSIRPLRSAMQTGRQAARLMVEELPAALALAAVLRRERPDVVHLGNGLRANFDGLLACLVARVPVVCHVKGFEKYRGRERWGSRRLDMMVCMTESVLRHCTEAGLSPRAARVVYDALDEQWFQPQKPAPALRAELGLPIDALVVGIIGNIQPWKGQDILVEAVARLAPAFPRLHGVVVGGTHRAGQQYESELRDRVGQLGLAGRVHFTGFRHDIPDVLQALDVVVHASVRPEPFGRVILEGMALGKPVIAANAGGVPEIIEHGRTGWLVPPGDADALATCLQSVLSEPGRASGVAKNGAQSVRRRFSLEQHVREMSEIYDQVVGKE